MKTKTIDGEKFVRASDIKKKLPKGDSSNPYLEVGKEYFVQTVTQYYTGRLLWVGDKEICMEDVAWIADTGRFHKFCQGEMAKEVEPIGVPVVIGRGAIVSAFEREVILEVK